MPKYISGASNTGILKDDIYPFQISSARLTKSKKGSDMIEVTLDVGNNSHSTKIRDWLVFDGNSFTSARIDQLRQAIGEVILPDEEILVEPSDLLHKTGRVHVIVDSWNGKEINRIGSYLEPENDEIPGLSPTMEPKRKAATGKQPF